MNRRPLRSSARPLALVELFALPGSGKTTIAEAVAERADVTTRKALSAKWADCSAVQQIAHVGRAFGNRSLLVRAMRFGRGAPIATPESMFRLVRLLAKTHWLRSQRGSMLLDQGFLQNLWSILVSGKTDRRDPELLVPLIEALYEGIDAKIVVIEVDAETALARIRARTEGDSRFEGLPVDQLHISLVAAERVQHQVVAAARLAGLPVVTLDGMVPPDQLADQLLSLLPEKNERNIVANGPQPRPSGRTARRWLQNP